MMKAQLHFTPFYSALYSAGFALYCFLLLYDETVYITSAPWFHMKAIELTEDVRDALRTELGLMFSQAPAVMRFRVWLFELC